MSFREIIKIGEKSLRQKSKPVFVIDNEIQKLIDDMFDTMYSNNGVGLAAPQVGENKRLFVIDIENVTEQPLVFINPNIIQKSTKTVSIEEGCLSIPGVRLPVIRSNEITVEFMDEKGMVKRLTADGILAIAVQHENDHLDGVLFPDRVEIKFKKKLIEEFKKNNLVYDREL